MDTLRSEEPHCGVQLHASAEPSSPGPRVYIKGNRSQSLRRKHMEKKLKTEHLSSFPYFLVSCRLKNGELAILTASMCVLRAGAAAGEAGREGPP